MKSHSGGGQAARRPFDRLSPSVLPRLTSRILSEGFWLSLIFEDPLRADRPFTTKTPKCA
jgi:hypothetical protein